MQVGLQLGCPWAGHGGHAAQRGALQRCPALQQERGELVPGQREAATSFSLSLGENHAGQRPPPRRGEQGRAWRGSQEPQLTPFMLCSTRASLAHTCCSPKPPWHARPPPRCVLESGLSPRARGKQRGQAKGPRGCSSARAEAAPVAPLGSWQGGGEGRGLCPPAPSAQSLSTRTMGRGVAGAAPLSQSCLAGEVLEDSLVREVVAVVVVGQDARVVGALHVPAQGLTGALWGWQSRDRVGTASMHPATSLVPRPAHPVHRSPRGHPAPWDCPDSAA